jgi:hypothetical protein
MRLLFPNTFSEIIVELSLKNGYNLFTENLRKSKALTPEREGLPGLRAAADQVLPEVAARYC